MTERVGLEKGNGRREEISCGFAILFFHLFAKRCVNACRSNPSTAFPLPVTPVPLGYLTVRSRLSANADSR